MQGKLLWSVHNHHQCQCEDRLHATEQENKGVAQAERMNPFFNQERGPTSLAIGKAQILCFAGLYTVGSDRPTNDERVFIFS